MTAQTPSAAPTRRWQDRARWFGGPQRVRRSLGLGASIVAAIGICWLAVSRSSVALTDLTRDPAVVAADRWYIGAISILGVAVWMSGSAVALAVSRFSSPRSRLPLAWFGALGIILAIDDALLIHEDVLAQHLGEGAEKVMYVAYASALVAGVILARREVFEPGSLLVLASGACLALSVALDVMDRGSNLEDGFKVVGIALWSAGLVERSFAELSRLKR